MVGRTSVSKIKNLTRKKKSSEDSGSETGEDFRAFHRMGGWPADVV